MLMNFATSKTVLFAAVHPEKKTGITHDYEWTSDILIFRRDQMKVMVENGIQTTYAYHYTTDGVKHGVEDVTGMKLVNVRTISNIIIKMFGGEAKDGHMDDNRNDCFVHLPNGGIEVGIHFARIDSDKGYDQSIWFTVKELDGEISIFYSYEWDELISFLKQF